MKRIEKIQILVIAILTIVVYGNTLKNEFVWDDKTFAGWELTKSFKYLPHILKGALPFPHEGDFRPVKGLILAVDYKLFGLEPFWYHLQAILIHLSVTIMVYLLTRTIVNTKLDQKYQQWVPFVTAILFGIHPIHTESVTFVTSSTDLIGILFFLAAFWLYIKASNQNYTRKILVACSVVLGFLAFVSYEVTLVLPFIIIAYDFSLRDIGVRGIFKNAKIYSVYVVAVGVYALMRFGILKVYDNEGYVGDSFFLTMLASVKALSKYVELVVIPLNLSINHEISEKILALSYVDYFPEAFLAQKITDSGFILSLILLAMLFCVAIVCFKKLPFVTFCMIWFFISLAPFSNLVPLNNLMTERYLYLASYGYCLILGIIFAKLFSLRKGKYFVVFVFVVVLFFFGIGTFRRNRDWKDSETLWSKALEQFPESVLANHNIGNVFLEREEYHRAIEHYRIADANNFRHIAQVNINFANAYQRSGQDMLAFGQYQKAQIADPNNYEVYFGLANLYKKQGNTDLAVLNFQKTIELKPGYIDAYINLGVLYAERGQHIDAITEFNLALARDKNLYVAYFNLGSIYEKEGKIDLATEYLLKAQKLEPENSELKARLERLQKFKILETIGKDNLQNYQK